MSVQKIHTYCSLIVTIGFMIQYALFPPRLTSPMLNLSLLVLAHMSDKHLLNFRGVASCFQRCFARFVYNPVAS